MFQYVASQTMLVFVIENCNMNRLTDANRTPNKFTIFMAVFKQEQLLAF